MNIIKTIFAALAVIVMTVVGMAFAALPYALAIVMAVLLLRSCS